VSESRHCAINSKQHHRRLYGVLISCLAFGACSSTGGALLVDEETLGVEESQFTTTGAKQENANFNSDQLFDQGTPEIKSAALAAPKFSNNEIDKQPRAPIAIDVRQAFLQEDTLQIKLGLRSKTFVRTDSIYVGVRGLADGVTVVEEFRLLADESNRKWLDQESNLLVSFSIPAEGLSEYQILGAWGDDARNLAKRLSDEKSKLSSNVKTATELGIEPADFSSSQKAQETRAKLGIVSRSQQAAMSTSGEGEEIRELRVVALEGVDIESELDDCPAEPCDLRYRIFARLKNLGETKTVDSIELAIGLYWASEGQLPQTPKSGSKATANEEVVALKNLAIAPGGSKAIRVRVNRGVPQIPGGRFVPHIRVLPE
jgi:hypothetical protein